MSSHGLDQTWFPQFGSDFTYFYDPNPSPPGFSAMTEEERDMEVSTAFSYLGELLRFQQEFRRRENVVLPPPPPPPTSPPPVAAVQTETLGGDLDRMEKRARMYSDKLSSMTVKFKNTQSENFELREIIKTINQNNLNFLINQNSQNPDTPPIDLEEEVLVQVTRENVKLRSENEVLRINLKEFEKILELYKN
jgi:hypothetical protein